MLLCSVRAYKMRETQLFSSHFGHLVGFGSRLSVSSFYTGKINYSTCPYSQVKLVDSGGSTIIFTDFVMNINIDKLYSNKC